MIETYKTMNGFNTIEKSDWFIIDANDDLRPTRSNTRIENGQEERKNDVIQRERARLEVRYHSFTVRVARSWNELPEAVKAQKSVNAFKNAYDKWRGEQSHPQN